MSIFPTRFWNPVEPSQSWDGTVGTFCFGRTEEGSTWWYARSQWNPSPIFHTATSREWRRTDPVPTEGKECKWWETCLTFITSAKKSWARGYVFTLFVTMLATSWQYYALQPQDYREFLIMPRALTLFTLTHSCWQYHASQPYQLHHILKGQSQSSIPLDVQVGVAANMKLVALSKHFTIVQNSFNITP